MKIERIIQEVGNMMKNNESISKSQFVLLLLQSQIGVGLLSLPYIVYIDAKNDGWISILIAGCGAFIILLIMWALCKQFPRDSIFDFNNIIVGKIIGKTISLLYIFYFFALSILIVLLSTNMLKKWILALTPEWILILFFIGVGVYLSRESLKIISRFYAFVTILIVLLVLLLLFAYSDVNVKYVFPVGHAGLKNIFIGSHDAIVSMLGFEIFLAVHPLIQADHNKKLLCGTISLLSVTLLYLYFTITSYIVFSPEEMLLVPEPILYMLKSFSFELVERLDLVFLSVWIVPMTTSFVTYLYLTSVGVSKLFNQKNHKNTTFKVGILVIVIAILFPKSEGMLDKYGKIIAFSSYFFILFIPLLLLVIWLIRKELGKGKEYDA